MFYHDLIILNYVTMKYIFLSLLIFADILIIKSCSFSVTEINVIIFYNFNYYSYFGDLELNKPKVVSG